VVRQTLHSNYYGTLAMTLKFLPLIKNGGRLVNVSSTAGSLHKFSPSIQKSFRDAKTVAEVTSLMQKFAGDVEAGKEKERGWVSAAYATSKAGMLCGFSLSPGVELEKWNAHAAIGVTGMTRAVAYQERQKGSKTLINACCPGYVATDSMYILGAPYLS
jgi:carbonyl reductase 1